MYIYPYAYIYIPRPSKQESDKRHHWKRHAWVLRSVCGLMLWRLIHLLQPSSWRSKRCWRCCCRSVLRICNTDRPPPQPGSRGGIDRTIGGSLGFSDCLWHGFAVAKANAGGEHTLRLTLRLRVYVYRKVNMHMDAYAWLYARRQAVQIQDITERSQTSTCLNLFLRWRDVCECAHACARARACICVCVRVWRQQRGCARAIRTWETH